MTTAARTFTPVAGIDRRYRVVLLEDRWVPESRTTRIVTAIGPGGAKRTALDLLLHDPQHPCPDAVATGVYLLCDACPNDHEAHDGQCQRGWYTGDGTWLRCDCEVGE